MFYIDFEGKPFSITIENTFHLLTYIRGWYGIMGIRLMCFLCASFLYVHVDCRYIKYVSYTAIVIDLEIVEVK